MINPRDRELTGVLSAIIVGARLHAYDSVRLKLAAQAGRVPEPPDIIDTVRIAVMVLHTVNRHVPPKLRKKP